MRRVGCGEQPKLKPNQAEHLLEPDSIGTYSCAELAEMFDVSRSTAYRTLHRLRPPSPDPERPFRLPVLSDRSAGDR